MKIATDIARELTYCHPGDPRLDGVALDVVENRQVGSRRWVSEHELVVRDDDGNLWSVGYDCGLTESQDIRPFEHEDDEVEFRAVRRKAVVRYEYEAI